MLTDSYNKLYNAKIKKFMKTTEASSADGESNKKSKTPGSSTVRLKHAAGLPRLGVDFGFLKTRPASEDLCDTGDTGDTTYGSNLNLPPLGLGTHAPLKANAQTPQLNAPDLNVAGAEDPKVNTATSKMNNSLDNLTVPNLERTQIGLDSSQNLKAPTVKMDIRGSGPEAPELEMNFDEENSTFAAYSPKVQIEGTNKEVKMPNPDFSEPSYSGPEYDLTIPSVPSGKQSLKRLKTPVLNIDDPSSYVGLPKVKLSGRSPDLDLDISGKTEFQPHLNGPIIDAPSGKLTLPKFGVSGKGDANVQTPDLNIESPKVKGKIRAQNINVPKADLKGPKFQSDTPAAALKGPSIKYKAPKFTMPKFDLPEIDLQTTDVDVASPKSKGDMNFPGVETKLDLDKPSGKLDFDASGKLRLPKFKLFGAVPNKEGVDINAGMTTPELKMKSPKINMDIPDTKVKSQKLDLSGTLPQGKGMNVKTDVKSPDFTLKTPKIKGGFDAPNVNLPNMELKTQTPEINIGSPKTKMPKFKMPQSNAPRLKTTEFNGKVNVPDVNAPGVNFNGPNINVATPSGKFRKPDLGISVSKLDGPKINLSGDINATEGKTPKTDFKAPRLDMSNVIIYNPPKLDADTPDVNVGSPKGKMKMPKIKMPRFSLPTFKGPEIDGNLNGPDLNAKTPSINLNGPKGDLDVDDAGPSRKLKRQNMSLPDLGLSSPNLDSPDLDLKSPVLDISGPNISSGINAPVIKIPKGDHKSPKLNLNAPKLDVDMTSGKLKMPELHGPDWDFNASLGKVKLPKSNLSLPKGPNLDVGANLKSPHLNLNAPKFQSETHTPEMNMDLKTSELKMKAPDFNIGSPKAKFKMPKFKVPKFSLPSLKGPEIDGNLGGPNMNINQPSVSLSVPHADLKMPDISGPSGKLKKPNLNQSEMRISGPSMDGPKLDLQLPDLDMPRADLKSPQLDLNATNINLPKGKLNLPELHSPKFPKVDLSGKLPQGPNLDINTGLQTPDLTLKAPSINCDTDTPHLDTPAIDIKAPKVDVNAPNVNIGSPKAKLGMPKIQMPEFELPSLKLPDINGSVDGPNMDMNAPSLDFESRKTDLDMPDVGLGSSGKLKMPNLNLPDLGLSGPKLDGPNLKLKSPDFVSGPSVGGGMNTPGINIPKADIPSGKLKMPELHGLDWDISPSNNLKLPKFNPSGSLPKGPKLDLNADLKSPDLHLKSPEMKAGINTPDCDRLNMDLKAPEFDVKGPDVNIGSPKTKLKMPKLKMPKVNLPNIKGPEFDGNFDMPHFDAPNVKLKGKKPSFEMPDVDLSANMDSGLNTTNIAMPDVNLKSPNLDLNTPNLDIDMPSGKVKMPTLTKPRAGFDTPDLDVDGPKLDANGPDANIGSPKPKFKMPKLKFPKFSFPGLKGPEIDGNLNAPVVDVDMPNTRGLKPNLEMPDVAISGASAKYPKPNFNPPDFDLSAPKFEGPNLDVKSPEFNISGSPKGKLKIPKLKKPKMSLPNVKGPEIDRNLTGPDLNANAPSLNFNGPKSDFDINVPGPSGKFKKPNLNLPDLGSFSSVLHGPNMDLKSPGLDISGPNIGGELKAPNFSMPDVNLKSSKPDFNTPNLDIHMPSGKGKMPTLSKANAEIHAPEMDIDAPSGKIKFPKLNLSGTLPKGPNLDLNADINTPDSRLKSPKIKGAFDCPDMDLPDMRVKSPKLDVSTPGVNIGSPKTKLKMPKLKMPKVSLQNIKGLEIDGNFDGPDVGINGPTAKLKETKPLFEIPEVGFGSSFGKHDRPHMSIPDVGFSSPDVDGPEFNFGPPALNTKLPKGSIVNINSDLKNPDLHLTAPKSKIKGAFHSPKMDLPKMDNKAPKLDMNAPNFNIGLPEANIKKSKIKMPNGPKIDINGDFQGPDFNVPNVDFDYLKGKLKMPSTNVSGLQAKTPEIDLSRNMPDVNLPDSRAKGPKTDLTIKRPDLQISGSMRQPQNSIGVPQVKGDIRGPDFDMNGPSGNIQGPQFDLDSANTKFRLPSVKLPQLGGSDLNRTGSDIDFGASLQPTNFSPPNANLSTKPSQIKGNITSPRVNTPYMDLGSQKVMMQNTQLHRKNPDLNIDDSLLNFNRPSVRNHRSDITGVNGKIPALDVDRDLRLQHHKRSTKMDVRSSCPLPSTQLGHHIGFDHSDLNIDDFTEKDYVLRARGSKNAHRDSRNHAQLVSAPVVTTGTNNHSETRGIPPSYDDLYAKVQKTAKSKSKAQLPPLPQDSRIRAADSTDGYLVTVFPSKIQNSNPTNRKYKTLGGTEFYATDVDLEVPNEKDLRGSTFFFYNFV